MKTGTFDPGPSDEAYDTDYPSTSTDIFGEWERLPMGDVHILPGEYNCQLFLTEESFHSWLADPLEGNWTNAISVTVIFTIVKLSHFVRQQKLKIQISEMFLKSYYK